MCISKGEEFCSLLVCDQHSVSHHWCLQMGHWPITGYTYVFQGNMVYYCSAKLLFIILYCGQRGNLDEFISDHDLGDVSSSASSTLYLTLKTAVTLSPFVFHSALV